MLLVEFCFFLKIIIKISRTLQAVKTCMGFVPFILARNQFLLFSQVLNMFEIGCCQASSLCVTGKFQWLHFSSHSTPTLSGPTAPRCSFSGPHTKSLSLKWVLIRALRHHQCVLPLGYLALHLGFNHQAFDCPGTHTASSAVAPALSPHRLPRCLLDEH